jgi:iron complex outermembrane recepter protein
MKKTVLLSILAVLLHGSLLSQYALRGTITDRENGEALAGAHITIVNTFLTRISGPGGEYRFANLREGTYLLEVSYVGYQTAVRELRVMEDTEAGFSLERATIMQDEVVIRGIRSFRQDPPSFTSINKEEIASENLGQDLPYLLAMTPSTVVTSDAGNGVGYTTMRIRGTDITGTNVTLNGIPLNDPESHGLWWVNMPDLASSASSLQVQRGVGTSVNGAAAFGASINIRTNQFSAIPYAEINSSAGPFNTFRNNAGFGTGLLGGRWTVDGRASWITSNGYIDRAASDLKSFHLSGAYNGENSIYRFNIFSGREKTYQAWAGVPKDSLKTNRTYNPYTYENETDNYQQDHYQFFAAHSFSRYWRVNAALFYIRGRGYYEQYKDDRSFNGYGLSNPVIGGDTISHTDLVQQKWLDNHFYGLTWTVNHKKGKLDLSLGGGLNQYLGDHFGKVIWAEFASAMGKDYEWYHNDGIKNDANIYLKANYQLLQKLNIYGDLQYRYIDYTIEGIHDDLRDISQQHVFRFFNPKAGLLYDINDRNSAYLSAGVARREPNRSVYRDAQPGEEPTFETLYDYEAGYKYSAPKAALSANIYYMDYHNQLVLTGKINNVGTPVMTNVKDSYRAGIELQAGIKFLKRLRWDLNAAFSRNRIRDFTAYVDNWNYWDDPDNEPYQYEEYLGETEISFSPSMTAGSMIDYEPVDDLHISLISTYVGKQYIDNTSSNERMLDPWLVHDIRLMYTFRTSFIREIGLQFRLNNIFCQEYESNAWVYRYIYNGQEGVMDGYFPQAPVNFFAGVSLRF